MIRREPSEFTSAIDAARVYLKRGYSVVPVPRGEKGPRVKGWQNLKLGQGDIPKYFAIGENIDVLTGAAGELADVDCDCPEERNLASRFLPETQMVHGRPSAPQSHFWFRVSPSPKHAKYNDPVLSTSDPKESTLVELRSGRHRRLCRLHCILRASAYIGDRMGSQRMSILMFQKPRLQDSRLHLC